LKLQRTYSCRVPHGVIISIRNTMKLLVACSPNSSISVDVSPAYTGRTSDKALTINVGYLDLIPVYQTIMADKGSNIAG